MLSAGKPLVSIIKTAAKLNPPLFVSKKNLFTHNHKHRLRSLVIDEVKLPAASDKAQTPEIELEREKVEVDKAIRLCEECITQVLNALVGKQINATITEALKAAELLQKIREGNPWEGVLRRFVMEVSLDHGFRK
jgi:hypothetical protein